MASPANACCYSPRPAPPPEKAARKVLAKPFHCAYNPRSKNKNMLYEAPMDVILLERVSRLGDVGDVVKVRDGFGRNFLIPQQKAVRATDTNRKEFEAKRATLEKRNKELRADAEKRAAELGNLSVKVVRQASEDGKLYGSVSARDIAVALAEQGLEIERRLIDLTSAIKSMGLYSATITLHPEVKVTCRVEVVRSLEASAYDELAEEPQSIDAADAPEQDEDAA
jgi:large subunit ribosomal protein L9